MTDVSTSLLLIGPTGVGSFNSPDWRVGYTAQLVEGSTNGPYWLFEENHGEERVLMIDSLFPEVVARSIALLTAVVTSNQRALEILEETHNVTPDSDPDGKVRLQIAPYWDLADDVMSQVSDSLSAHCRLGLVTLDETTVANEEVIAHLLDIGFTVDSFVSRATRS